MRKVLYILVGFCVVSGAAALYVGESGTAIAILGALLVALIASRHI